MQEFCRFSQIQIILNLGNVHNRADWEKDDVFFSFLNLEIFIANSTDRRFTEWEKEWSSYREFGWRNFRKSIADNCSGEW